MVRVFDHTINLNPLDAGELLGEAAWKLSGHVAQQAGVINSAKKMQRILFDQVVVLQVDVLVGQTFVLHAEIDLLHVHIGQLKAAESEPKVAASQPLCLA